MTELALLQTWNPDQGAPHFRSRVVMERHGFGLGGHHAVIFGGTAGC